MSQSFLAADSRVAPADAPLSPAARRWLRQRGVAVTRARAIPGDASGRRYWRLPGDLIFMDAPPPEDILPFLRVQRRFARAALPVPRVLAAQVVPGFVLLEDLGTVDLKAVLDAGMDVDRWMRRAMVLIRDLQWAGQRQGMLPPLPFFSAARLQEELTLFIDWYLGGHLGLTLDPHRGRALRTLFDVLLKNATTQAQVWVHRDFHARNLVCQGAATLVMIDFQDAVRGPWTYDLVSLLWDRYWDWGRARRDAWALDFLAMVHPGIAPPRRPADFLVSVGRMALQRNLKILGVFCRLAYRDGKIAYLDFLPRFWAYVWEALGDDPQLLSYQALFAPWAPPLPGR